MKTAKTIAVIVYTAILVLMSFLGTRTFSPRVVEVAVHDTTSVVDTVYYEIEKLQPVWIKATPETLVRVDSSMSYDTVYVSEIDTMLQTIVQIDTVKDTVNVGRVVVQYWHGIDMMWLDFYPEPMRVLKETQYIKETVFLKSGIWKFDLGVGVGNYRDKFVTNILLGASYRNHGLYLGLLGDAPYVGYKRTFELGKWR